MSELLDVVLQQLMNWSAAAPGNNAAGINAGGQAGAGVPVTAAAAATAAHHQQQQQDVSTPRAAAAAVGQGALQDAGSVVTHMQGSLQHTQVSLDRVGANLTAIQGVLLTPNNTYSTLAAQYQALLQERTALQQLYGQLVAEGEAAGTRLELLLSATRARQQQQGGVVTDASGDGGSAESQQQQQRREAARRLLLGGSSSSSTSSSPTAAGRGGISQLLIPNSSSSSRPVSVAPPTGRLPAAQRPPAPDRSVVCLLGVTPVRTSVNYVVCMLWSAVRLGTLRVDRLVRLQCELCLPAPPAGRLLAAQQLPKPLRVRAQRLPTPHIA
jgi:hypothetical protein